ncbi:MAG: hypothetical protein JRC77_11405 [Deltaproteobacteria bacterium]|nr:hypothetical protein [Deltaproteobacteria bacterium]
MGFQSQICVTMITGFLATGCASTGVLQHEDLNKHLLEIDSVVIAPPVVSIEYVAFDSLNERMRDEEERIRRSLVNVAERALYDHGYDVVEFDFEQALNEDSEFAFRVELLRHEFGFIRRELRENPNKPEGSRDSFRSSVGSIANTLSEKSGADAILLMHYNGFQKSAGLIVKDATVALAVGVLTGITLVSPQNGATVELVMIDGTTGSVLWADVRGAAGLNAQATKTSMEDLPHDVDVGEDEDEAEDLEEQEPFE